MPGLMGIYLERISWVVLSINDIWFGLDCLVGFSFFDDQFVSSKARVYLGQDMGLKLKFIVLSSMTMELLQLI